MTLENLKNYLKTHTDVGEGIALGGIDGNLEHCLGVYPGKPPPRQRVCLGGSAQTVTGELYAVLLLHWGQSMAQALHKAQEVWGLFYAMSSCDMDGASVCLADPGGGPVPIGRDERGICEFIINLRIIYDKE